MLGISEILASTPIHALVELLCTPSLDNELNRRLWYNGGYNDNMSEVHVWILHTCMFKKQFELFETFTH